jgi:hypothetical protein
VALQVHAAQLSQAQLHTQHTQTCSTDKQ